MSDEPHGPPVGVLLSGGLDSAVLVGQLLRQGWGVQPLYVQSGLVWQQAELSWLERLLAKLQEDFAGVAPLVVLDEPLADVYDGHWSLTGRDPPGANTSDDAVYLPGRNALLLLKASLWCQLRGIEQLAIGVLSTNPFPDATAGFFDAFQAAVEQGTGKRVRVLRPLADLTKCQVMELGRGLPLELTFSCIAPVAETHCGQCNKCAERQAAFRMARQPDPTSYVHMPSSLSPRQRLATSGGREE